VKGFWLTLKIWANIDLFLTTPVQHHQLIHKNVRKWRFWLFRDVFVIIIQPLFRVFKPINQKCGQKVVYHPIGEIKIA
jgi:hypothetical protein